jgi:hypothetical protein
MPQTKTKPVYRIQFHQQGNLYEIYARRVSQGALYAFVEVEEILFGERSQVVLDPSEERLKAEFAGVRRTYIPLHAVVRIDEVEKQGVNKIVAASSEGAGGAKITPFPLTVPPPSRKG